MKKLSRHHVQVCFFGCFIAWMFLFCVCKPQTDISLSERRPLKQFPKISWNHIMDGTFMKDFDSYSVDQFPFRESFRECYAFTISDIFQQKDMEGLYEKNKQIIAMEYPLHTNSLQHATNIFQFIYQQYLKDSGGNVFLSIIPDKSYFLQNNSQYLTMDYSKLMESMQQTNPQMTYIDIASLLKLEHYYKTDPHWKQECILPIAEKLSQAMGTSIASDFSIKSSDVPFYGTYAGQSAKKLEADHIQYLWSSSMKDWIIYDHQNKKEIDVYNVNKLNDRDPYELYLNGPISYITIENPNARTEKELIIFRDSFTSPLAPLLATGYRTVTLLDIRYLPSRTLKNHVDFLNKDVLFLYSTSVLNHSETLK